MITGQRIGRETTRDKETVKEGQAQRVREETVRETGAERLRLWGRREMLITRDSERAEMVSQTAQQSQRLRQRNVPKEVAGLGGGVLQQVTGPRVFFGHAAWSTWDLSSPTRDRTRTPCSRSMEA